MSTHAARAARKFFPKHRAKVKQIAQDVLPVAVHTRDRAYQFVEFPDGSKLEVRVWPDGTVKRTVVTTAGDPLVPDKLPKVKL